MTNELDTTAKCVISRLDSRDAVEKHLSGLTALLQNCVNDDPANSSLGFLAPLPAQAADAYWLSLPDSISGANPSTVLLIATLGDQLLGTAQIARIPKQTQDFRGEVRKLLVRSDTRGLGLGKRMMVEVERVATEEMKLDTLALDTDARSPARGFYHKLGWTEWGVFPLYAKAADGVRHDCAFFLKRLDL
ncbi:hypothetical protein NLU13_4345 [Sarocladium strictum]|uniref:N-acetyltransferase domain-containing protein n=1 Tax=Sarocladium strictum TaxID=5046 RepID=A0AA39GJ18_SARSR|nr:hypothetical protein NLU13_4345 [Sarocladium strictum]